MLVLALYHTVDLPPRLREPHRQQMMSMKKFQMASRTCIHCGDDELFVVGVKLMMKLTVVIPPTIAMMTEAIAEMTDSIARPTMRFRKQR